MFTLRHEQLAALSERRFERKLVAILVGNEPAAGRSLCSPEGSQMMHLQCAKARSFGMTAELDIARYVITAWLLGSDFDERFPAMTEILNTDRLTPAQKALAVERVCVAVLQGLREAHA